MQSMYRNYFRYTYPKNFAIPDKHAYYSLMSNVDKTYNTTQCELKYIHQKTEIPHSKYITREKGGESERKLTTLFGFKLLKYFQELKRSDINV